MRALWKQYRASVLCIGISLILYLLTSIILSGSEEITAGRRLLRDGYGGDEKRYEILTGGLGEKELSVTVEVTPRVYTKMQAAEAFEAVMESIPEKIKGENPSLMEVTRGLKLPSGISGTGIRLKWYSSEPDLIDASGRLLREVHEEADVVLYVECSAEIAAEESGNKEHAEQEGLLAIAQEKTGIYRQNYEVPVRVLPVSRTEEEQSIAEFAELLKTENELQKTSDTLELPEDFHGQQLHYREKKSGEYEVILLLGITAAGLLAFREKSQEQEKRKKREKELLLDYSEVLSKLVVLAGAGLTIRNAWERIAADYEAATSAGKTRKRAAYEEVIQTCSQLKRGISEGEAYRDFGRRCGLAPYLKLSSMLEQNRRTGTKNLREVLRQEMTDALEQRKNLARKLGEEAGTKLLLPLFLMLGIIMVMIMVPAMMAMG